MKIVVFKGGLGNQLFQYQFYKFLESQKIKVRALDCVNKSHNGLEFDKFFVSDVKYCSRLWYILYKYSLKIKSHLGIKNDDSVDYYNKSLLSFFAVGYWQDKKYITPAFQIKFKQLLLSEQNRKILKEIDDTNSISIHIRRGDYLKPNNQAIFGNICTAAYYAEAVNFMEMKFNEPKFFIFSDDIQWTKENISLTNAVYITWNKGKDSVYDMYLMSKCKANIIANSTFSFWGAYISKNKLVIYPSKWFNNGMPAPNIFRDEWVGL